MKLKTILLSGLLVLSPSYSFAAEDNPFAMGNSLSQINNSLLNLGKYLGNWSLTSPPVDSGAVNSTVNANFWPALIGALAPIPTVLTAQLPLTQAVKTNLDLWGGTATTYYNYNSANLKLGSAKDWRNTKSDELSVLPFLDQQAYQPLPTLQVIQNLLVTPPQLYTSDSAGPDKYDDLTNLIGSKTATEYCSDSSATCLYNIMLLESIGGVSYNKISDVSDATFREIFGSDVSSLILPSLSFDSVIGPLTYSTDQDPNMSGSTSDDTFYQGGLYGNTELKQADAFIRYASGQLIPIEKTTDLDSAIKALNTGDYSDRFKNAQAINAYIVKLRSYAAQASVGISNLYALLAKRITITDESGSPVTATGIDGQEQPVSQESHEFKMAVRRFVPIQGNGKDKVAWVNMIKQADPAHVQRETALLLAEINYQLYLNRQIQERMLATMSAMQLQVLSTARESVTFTPPQ